MPNNMKILSEELKKYTKPTHLVDFTLGQDSSGNPIFASASETAETVDGWLTAGDNVVYRVQYGQGLYAYATTTDHHISQYIMMAMFVTTPMFGPNGVYRLEAKWKKTDETWNALPTIDSVIPMENDCNPDAIAQPFSTSSTYEVGDVVMHDRLRYRCTTAVSTAGAWNSSSWTLEDVQTALDEKLDSVPLATASVPGIVKPDSNTITVDANGVLSANTTLSVISLNEFSEWSIEYCSPSINIENITYNGSWIVSGTYTGVQGKYDDSQMVWPEAGTPFSNNTGFTNESALEIYDNGSVELYNFHLTRSIVPVASGYVLGNQTDKPLAPLSVVSDLTAHTSNSDIHFTANERTKLSGITTGAQVNVLEGVKVGTTALTPTNKVVTVPLATSSNVGVVKPDGTTITVDSSGTLSANVPTITMRVYDED